MHHHVFRMPKCSAIEAAELSGEVLLSWDIPCRLKRIPRTIEDIVIDFVEILSRSHSRIALHLCRYNYANTQGIERIDAMQALRASDTLAQSDIYRHIHPLSWKKK